MKEELKTYLLIIFGVVIIVMFLLKGCTNPFPNLNDIKPDKIEIREHHDTLWRDTTLIKFKSIIHPKWDTIYKNIDSTIDLSILEFTKVYEDTLSDSEQTIYTNANVTGYLNNLDVSYRFKRTPKVIINTDSIFITKTSQPNRFSLYTGLRLNGNTNSLNLSPYIEFNKNKLSVSASYGLIDKTIGIGVGYKIISK